MNSVFYFLFISLSGMDIWTLSKRKRKITLKELKTAKGDINDKDKFECTPFYYIYFNSYFIKVKMEILRYCCEVLKADINVKNNSGFTPFDHLYDLTNNHNIL